jgi:hypothetical protein
MNEAMKREVGLGDARNLLRTLACTCAELSNLVLPVDPIGFFHYILLDTMKEI